MKHISLSFNSNQSNASTYLAATGIVLSSTALSIPNAHAARIAVSEVVIYEGEPIDYSNRDDVIFIDESSLYDDFSTVVSAPNNISNPTDSSSSQTTAVAKQTSPAYQAQPQVVSKTEPKQSNAIAHAEKKSIAPTTQVKLSKPFDKPLSKTKNTIAKTANKKAANSETAYENPELAAFYANALEFKRRGYLNKRTVPKTKTVRKEAKNLAQKKSKTKLNEVQLSLKMTKDKTPKVVSNESLPNQALTVNVKGKDPELVAFYMDVFAKQNHNPSNQTRSTKTLTVKQIPTKTIAHKKVITKKKSNEVQLTLKTKKAKDPELVAFYNQVFSKDAKNSSKQNPVNVASKVKDPELVAFYEREFGKGVSPPIMPKLKNRISKKVDVVAKVKTKKSIAKKIVKKVKVKTKSSIDNDIAALEKLIGDLQAQNII